jgi:hypothetical protein
MGVKASTDCCYANAFGKGAKERTPRSWTVSANRRLIAQSFLRARDVVISGSSTAIVGAKGAPVAP